MNKSTAVAKKNSQLLDDALSGSNPHSRTLCSVPTMFAFAPPRAALRLAPARMGAAFGFVAPHDRCPRASRSANSSVRLAPQRARSALPLHRRQIAVDEGWGCFGNGYQARITRGVHARSAALFRSAASL